MSHQRVREPDPLLRERLQLLVAMLAMDAALVRDGHTRNESPFADADYCTLLRELLATTYHALAEPDTPAVRQRLAVLGAALMAYATRPPLRATQSPEWHDDDRTTPL